MLTSLILTIVLLQCDPASQMCWALPNLPPVDTPTPGALSVPTPVHSGAYATQVATDTARLSTLGAPINDSATQVNGWLGSSATNVPSASGGDFNTGVSSIGNAFAYADDLGSKVGDGMELGRALTHFGNSGFGVLFLAMIIAAIFSAVISVLIFAGQVGEMIFNLFDDVMVWITNMIP
jgi:hypothetical protein